MNCNLSVFDVPNFHCIKFAYILVLCMKRKLFIKCVDESIFFYLKYVKACHVSGGKKVNILNLYSFRYGFY